MEQALGCSLHNLFEQLAWRISPAAVLRAWSVSNWQTDTSKIRVPSKGSTHILDVTDIQVIALHIIARDHIQRHCEGDFITSLPGGAKVCRNRSATELDFGNDIKIIGYGVRDRGGN